MSAAMAEVLPKSVEELQAAIQGLIARVLVRIRQEMGFECPYGYPPLTERVERVLRGEDGFGGVAFSYQGELEGLATDLQAMLDGPVEQLRRMVRVRSATSNCYPPGFALEQHRARMTAITLQHREAQNPRVSPAELVQRFAAQGVMIQAVDGNLHVSPVELLGDADREVLRANKAAILEALARPAAVL